MSNSSQSKFTSLCLKTAGIVLISSSLVDYISLLIPFEPFNSQWQIPFTLQLVDRGIVPMVGISLLLIGYWIQSNTNQNTSTTVYSPFRSIVLILSFVLGVIFLILLPLQLFNLSEINSAAVANIEQNIGVAETRISEQFAQLNSLASDPQRLQQLEKNIEDIKLAIKNKEFRGQQLNPQELQELEENKKQLESFRDLAKNPQELQTRLDESQKQLEKEKGRVQIDASKEGIRTALSSLFLAIGYLAIGWFGLQGSKKEA